MVAKLCGHRHTIRDLCFNRATNQLFTASYDKTVKIWHTDAPAPGSQAEGAVEAWNKALQRDKERLEQRSANAVAARMNASNSRFALSEEKKQELTTSLD